MSNRDRDLVELSTVIKAASDTNGIVGLESSHRTLVCAADKLTEQLREQRHSKFIARRIYVAVTLILFAIFVAIYALGVRGEVGGSAWVLFGIGVFGIVAGIAGMFNDVKRSEREKHAWAPVERVNSEAAG